jgi:pimeloyl-ACP methyl ester carboxylesterase
MNGIVGHMEAGVAGFRYDRRWIFPSEIPDAELASVSRPTQLLLGSREMIYDADAAAERARSLITGPADVVPDLWHLLGMQNPVVVNPRILQFLRSLSAGGQARPPPRPQ